MLNLILNIIIVLFALWLIAAIIALSIDYLRERKRRKTIVKYNVDKALNKLHKDPDWQELKKLEEKQYAHLGEKWSNSIGLNLLTLNLSGVLFAISKKIKKKSLTK